MYTIFNKWRAFVLVFLTHQLALPMLRLVRRPQRFPYTLEQLLQMPMHTLGYQLGHFVKLRQLQLLPHYARHDIKHILLGYDTTGDGEVCLQSFMFGNGRISFPVVTTLLYGAVTMPEYWGRFVKAWRRGRAAVPIHNWQWWLLLPESLETLQQKINNTTKYV